MRSVVRVRDAIVIYFVHASHRIMDCWASVVFETAPLKIKASRREASLILLIR
jgi:hypothetical protein